MSLEHLPPPFQSWKQLYSLTQINYNYFAKLTKSMQCDVIDGDQFEPVRVYFFGKVAKVLLLLTCYFFTCH